MQNNRKIYKSQVYKPSSKKHSKTLVFVNHFITFVTKLTKHLDMKRLFCILVMATLGLSFSFAQETFNYPATGATSFTINIPTEEWTVNNTNGIMEFHPSALNTIAGAVILPCPDPASELAGDTLVYASVQYLTNTFQNIAWDENTSDFLNSDVSFVKQTGNGTLMDENSNPVNYNFNMYILSTPDGNIFSLVSYCKAENLAEFNADLNNILMSVVGVVE